MQILLWILCSQIHKEKSLKVTKSFLHNENLFRTILSKLDRSASSITKGRIYIYIYFYLNYDGNKISILLENNHGVIGTGHCKLTDMLQKQYTQE